MIRKNDRVNMSLQNVLLKLVRINTNYYSFLSGVFISLSINLYTGVFSGEEISPRWRVILLSSFLTFISSFCWIFVSWKLDPIQKLATSESPQGINPEQTYKALLSGNEISLSIIFTGGMISAIIGLIVLLFGY